VIKKLLAVNKEFILHNNSTIRYFQINLGFGKFMLQLIITRPLSRGSGQLAAGLQSLRLASRLKPRLRGPAAKSAY